MTVTVDVGQATVCGRRARNEDAVEVLPSGIAVVGDGVGGNPDGARASALAVHAAVRWLDGHDGDPVVGLMTAPLAAADALAGADPPLHPRAATGLAVAQVRGGVAYALAVGDCRVSVLREAPSGSWSAVSATVDHDRLMLAARDVAAALRLGREPRTLAAAAVTEAGRRLLAAVRPHRPRHPETPVLATPMESGDLVLLTTDGVHDALGTVGVCEALVDLPAGVGATAISDALVRQALAVGAEDNCSAAVIRLMART